MFKGIVLFVTNILYLFYKIEVRGKENLPNGPFVLASNHISNWDPVFLYKKLKNKKIRFMAKKELFRVPVVSWLVGLMGAFPVDRGGNDVGAIKKAVNMVKDGECMGIFPQGHRYPEVDPRSTPAKNGAALICTKAEADIVPVYIARKDNRHKLFRKTWVVIGDPIPFEELEFDRDASGEYARITDKIFDRICSLGENFSEEEAKAHIKEMKRK